MERTIYLEGATLLRFQKDFGLAPNVRMWVRARSLSADIMTPWEYCSVPKNERHLYCVGGEVIYIVNEWIGVGSGNYYELLKKNEDQLTHEQSFSSEDAFALYEQKIYESFFDQDFKQNDNYVREKELANGASEIIKVPELGQDVSLEEANQCVDLSLPPFVNLERDEEKYDVKDFAASKEAMEVSVLSWSMPIDQRIYQSDETLLNVNVDLLMEKSEKFKEESVVNHIFYLLKSSVIERSGESIVMEEDERQGEHCKEIRIRVSALFHDPSEWSYEKKYYSEDAVISLRKFDRWKRFWELRPMILDKLDFWTINKSVWVGANCKAVNVIYKRLSYNKEYGI